MEDKYKIDILLKEYETLRQEILSRANNRFLMLGMVGAFLGYVLLTDNPILRIHIWGISMRAFILVIGVIGLLAIWLLFGYFVGTAAKRISVIERKINQLAGEELLEWETRYGWGRWGRFSGARNKKT